MPFFSKYYSLRKSRHIFRSSYKWYKKKGYRLAPPLLEQFKEKLKSLNESLKVKDREKSDLLAREVEAFSSAHFSKSFFDYISEFGIAIALALIIATIVRQSWFEPYEIPTGSMRPTYEEKDRLTVSKTAFGINIPLMTKHLYFDPSLVRRGGVIIWSGDGVPHLDSNSSFLGIFPYTKRFIKRCIGKPGDWIYFYGGKIYGIDKEGNELLDLQDDRWMDHLEHIPFINFEGRVSTKVEQKKNTLLFHQMNQLIGRLVVNQKGKLSGEIFDGKEWIKDNPGAQNRSHSSIQTYSDFWGMKNYAMARLLTKEQISNLGLHETNHLPNASLYLEIKHTPSLAPSSIEISNRNIWVSGFHSLIPLNENHLKAIMGNMYTARFVIKNGLAERYHIEEGYQFHPNSPHFPGVPDGTYEFYHGIGYSVGWQGILYQLPKEHPLMQFSASLVQKLFNQGIEMAPGYNPAKQAHLFPHRYAYFREGDLYLLGAPIIKRDDSTLKEFLAAEKERERSADSNSETSYVAFRDYGPPLKEGKIDLDFLQTFGFHLPENSYLVLGDNHAMSQDSRYFGPIPQENIQGAPTFILWPPGERWGFPKNNPYPFITLPRVIVWAIVLVIAGVLYAIYRRRWANVRF